jgi:hypothetical protein
MIMAIASPNGPSKQHETTTRWRSMFLSAPDLGKIAGGALPDWVFVCLCALDCLAMLKWMYDAMCRCVEFHE